MIHNMWMVSFFIIGTIFGSFYNVVGLRIPNGQSIIKPNSKCPRCGHDLKWYELIPILSFIFLGGRCRNCKEKISIMYPLIELFCGILFMISYYSYGFSLDLIIALIISSLLILIIVSDLTYMIIPDSFTIIAGVIVLIIQFIKKGFLGGLVCLGYGFIAFASLYLIMYISSKIMHKETLGGGDIKLFFVVGLIFPPFMSLLVLGIASFIALPISMLLLFKNREHIIPFGPFIVLAQLLLFFTKIDMSQITNFIKSL